MIVPDLPEVLAVAVHVIEREPAQSLEDSYARQLDTLQKVRADIADVATSRKRIELQLEEQRLQDTELRQRIENAEAAGRFDQSAAARNEHDALKRQIRDLSDQQSALASEEEKLMQAAQRLQVKIETFRTRRKSVEAVRAAGSTHEVLDQTNLAAVETTLLELRQASESDIATAAAALLCGLVRRRPFPQSNRRIALVATLQLLALNGRDLDVEPSEELNSQLDHITCGASQADLAT